MTGLQRATTLLAISGVALAFSNPSSACSCLATTQAAAFAQANTVFRGRLVQEINVPGEAAERWLVFDVSQVWKGEVVPTKVLDGNVATCSVGLPLSDEYVIYSADGNLLTLCDRVIRDASIQPELQTLGVGTEPVQAGVLDRLRHEKLAGSWYNPERSGEGLVVEVLEDGRGVAYFYGYDPIEPQTQLWLAGAGEFDGSSLVIDPIYRPRGGGWGSGFDPENVDYIEWGSARLDLGLGGTGTIRLNYQQGIFPVHIDLELQRLTRPPPRRVAAED